MGLGPFALNRPAFGEVRSGEAQEPLRLGAARSLASDIDWVEKGAVTPVKNQVSLSIPAPSWYPGGVLSSLNKEGAEGTVSFFRPLCLKTS